MIEWAKYRLNGLYFTAFGRNGVVERFPRFCPDGHPLGPDTVLVGSYPCLCAGRPHRTWRCWACDSAQVDSVWVWPPCIHHPEWTAWVL